VSRVAPGTHSVEVLLAELRSRDVQLRVDGDRLRCNAPAGVLSAELRTLLQERKSEILEWLRPAEAVARQPCAIVPLQPHGTGIPVFGVPGHNGDVFCYQHLAKVLGSNQPFYGLQPPGLDGKTKPMTRVENIAEYFANQIRDSYASGPYVIAAYCAGGSIAFELARLLQQGGGNVSLLTLFGCPYPTFYKLLAARLWAKRMLMNVLRLVNVAPKSRLDEPPDPVTEMRAKLERVTVTAVRRYTPGQFSGRMCLILPNRQWLNSACTPLAWRAHCDHVEEHFGPDDCDLNQMLRGSYAPLMAEFLNK